MNNTFFKYAGLVALIQTIEAASLRNHDSDAALKKNLSHVIDDNDFGHHGGPGMAGDRCFGFDETTGEKFGACAKGLMCKQTAEVSIPGAGKTCVFPPAQIGETCEGFNENTAMPFPDCDKGL